MIPEEGQAFDAVWPAFELADTLAEELAFLGLPALATNEHFTTIAPPSTLPVFWKSYWAGARLHRIESIGGAAKFLKSQGPLWTPFFAAEKRRTLLIAEELRCRKPAPLEFGKMLPDGRLGGFALLNKDTLVYCLSIDPNTMGEELLFRETEEAPSRAYLKLWEFFMRLRHRPPPGAQVADFGACPGGWTWVLANLGCEVHSFDKAPLDPRVSSLKNVHFQKKDIFKIRPAELPALDWFFSDVIAYPDKLYEYVEGLLAAKAAKNYVITIKFQGATDFEALRKWRAIPGSKCVHLGVNRHELTWFLLS